MPTSELDEASRSHQPRAGVRRLSRPMLSPACATNYAAEPADLEFHGAIIWSKGGSASGTYSEATLDLNRSALLEGRSECVRNLLRQIDLIQSTADFYVREALKEDFVRELAADKEYAALARALHATHAAFQ
jgi:hypothetical protein